MKLAYLDASAVVKLFKREPETPALREALDEWPMWASSEIVTVEARCTAWRLGGWLRGRRACWRSSSSSSGAR